MSVPTSNLPVYYVNAGNSRLVREFHPLVGTDAVSKTRSAVAHMLGGKPLDPDYRTLWPSGASVRSVQIQGSVAVVDLTGAASNPGVGALGEAQAVQQLVWTVTAVTDLPEVRLLLDGLIAEQLWGHVAIDKPLLRAPAVEVLAPVWLISPQHGDKVGREVTLHIAGIAFEATVNFDVRQGATVVQQGFVTLSAGPPQQGEAKKTLQLAPGTYTLRAFIISAEDSSVRDIDDHTVIVG